MLYTQSKIHKPDSQESGAVIKNKNIMFSNVTLYLQVHVDRQQFPLGEH